MISSLATLWSYFLQQRARLVALILMSGLFSAVTVLQPWPMKVLVDYALGNAGKIAVLSASAMIWGAAGATLGLFLINALLDVVVSWTWMATGQRMVYDLTADVFERLLCVPFPSQRRSVGDCLERLSGDTWSVDTVASERGALFAYPLIGIPQVFNDVRELRLRGEAMVDRYHGVPCPKIP